MIKQTIQSWGRTSAYKHHCVPIQNQHDAKQQMSCLSSPMIAYGMGRSYGDACLNADKILLRTTNMDAIMQLDSDKGIITCETGILLADIQNLIVPQGWMLPVTPGTEYITVGGAIAHDVHGKNYHTQGTFGHHIQSMTIVRSNGDVIACSPKKEKDWFMATIGGMGLTGLITQATIKLKPINSAYMNVQTLTQSCMDDFIQYSDISEQDWEYTVAWMDCLSDNAGRGIFTRATMCDDERFDVPERKTKSMPFTPPISLVNKLALRPFNWLYYGIHAMKSGVHRQDYKNYLYPLDSIHNWNRIYGKRGFYQYQSVVPKEVAVDATEAMQRQIRLSGDGSFLSVLKTFSDKKPIGLMSFPMEGITLALDFPNKEQKTMQLFDRLNAIVAEAGGRIYTAKDACQPRSLFESGYPNLHNFLQYRDQGFSSQLSRRLIGE